MDTTAPVGPAPQALPGLPGPDPDQVTPGGVLTRRAPTQAFEVHLDVYSGPFDLLLGLIAKHKLDITEISLAKVTDEFIAHIRAARSSEAGWDLSQASEFVLVAATLLDGADLLARSCDMLRRLCVAGIEANEEQCRSRVRNSTAAATALLPVLGYEGVCGVVERARRERRSVREIVLDENILTAERFEELISPEAVCRLGTS